ncbi:uncharacterized protein J4E87_009509 [Alternaria ethzedia]|uniref:uncharacterized protein n=1 Tax=Alternaria ethzedia TaxID=181014 RepID=UPI0020C47C1A|nr:uncharacterized protein J4E87_009509 [Alternaria ethzedia]KAI4614289.1 hypothetical protein J4E87_009509 [Alternaria ethzedia]
MDPAIGVRGQRNGIATMAVLIDHGADVNYVSKKWATPLDHAVRHNAKEKLLYLLKHGADPTIRCKERGREELYEILKAAELGQP